VSLRTRFGFLIASIYSARSVSKNGFKIQILALTAAISCPLSCLYANQPHMRVSGRGKSGSLLSLPRPIVRGSTAFPNGTLRARSSRPRIGKPLKPRIARGTVLTYFHRGILRYTQEEYHYIMTGNPSSESWSYTSHNRGPHRESPERRRQGRGRASFGRPISVGSARFVAPGAPAMNHQGASQRAHALVTPNAPNPTPHRSSSPTPLRTEGGASSSHIAGPSLSGQPSGTANTAEEPSPSVAVGSGVVPDQRSSSLGNVPQIPQPYFDHSTDGWYDAFPSHGGRTNLPPIANYRPRPMNDSSALPPLFHEQIPDGFGGPPTNPSFPPGQTEGPRDGSYAHFQNRWSSQFLH
jgi:hypothetical protein